MQHVTPQRPCKRSQFGESVVYTGEFKPSRHPERHTQPPRKLNKGSNPPELTYFPLKHPKLAQPPF